MLYPENALHALGEVMTKDRRNDSGSITKPEELCVS